MTAPIPAPPNPPPPLPPDDHAPLRRGIAARRRSPALRAEGERTFFRSLGMIGGLGWMIVLPTLGGLALGRWLDARLGGGLVATGALLMVGLALGCRLAWLRIHQP